MMIYRYSEQLHTHTHIHIHHTHAFTTFFSSYATICCSSLWFHTMIHRSSVYIHYDTYTTIHTLRYIHYNTYTTIHTLRYAIRTMYINYNLLLEPTFPCDDIHSNMQYAVYTSTIMCCWSLYLRAMIYTLICNMQFIYQL